MRRIYDIAIIGAGPVGSYAAYQLADKGFSVALFDSKKQIGKDVVCSGVIGKKAFQKFDLPAESILNRISVAHLISPFNQRLEYAPGESFAYVVDRSQFDRGLLQQAMKTGVEVRLGRKIDKLSRHERFWELCSGQNRYRAKYVVLCTGVNSDLHRQAGLPRAARFLYGSQIELPGVRPRNTIEIYMGRAFAPGSFGWVIPAGDALRIGVIVSRKGQIWLKKMLARLKYPAPGIENAMQMKPIVYGPIARSAGDRIIALGEAAGQVKTTTGGGIHYGLLSSEIAVERIEKSVDGNADLRDYDVTWRSALASEHDIGFRVRAIAAKVGDQEMEKLFTFVKKHRFWVDLLVPRIDFDFHSNFIYFCIKSFSSFLKILS